MAQTPAGSREELQQRIAALKPELKRLGVRTLALFGSAARDAVSADSDVDMLVEFDGPARFDPFMDLKLLLEEVLGRRVDLVTPDGLKPALRVRIEPELLREWPLGYQDMAADEAREREAEGWTEGLVGDVADEPR
jgi:predicted nucleotidyltransferase